MLPLLLQAETEAEGLSYSSIFTVLLIVLIILLIVAVFQRIR